MKPTNVWDDISERVKKGAIFMDERDTVNPDLDTPWYNDIDLATLSMADCQLCIMGQRFGMYDPCALFISEDQAIEMGFNVEAKPFPKEGYWKTDPSWELTETAEAFIQATRRADDLEYTLLGIAWEGEILKRRHRDLGSGYAMQFAQEALV